MRYQKEVVVISVAEFGDDYVTLNIRDRNGHNQIVRLGDVDTFHLKHTVSFETPSDEANTRIDLVLTMAGFSRVVTEEEKCSP